MAQNFGWPGWNAWIPGLTTNAVDEPASIIALFAKETIPGVASMTACCSLAATTSSRYAPAAYHSAPLETMNTTWYCRVIVSDVALSSMVSVPNGSMTMELADAVFLNQNPLPSPTLAALGRSNSMLPPVVSASYALPTSATVSATGDAELVTCVHSSSGGAKPRLDASVSALGRLS